MAELKEKYINYGGLQFFHDMLINDTGTTETSTWSSQKIASEIEGVTFEEGTGIELSGKTISANSDATTIDDIDLSNGAPINALGIWENNKIPQGTSIQEILEKLLCREVFPNAATKPNMTVNGSNLGVKELGSTVTITQPTTTRSNGTFNASFSSPAQPAVQGVSWSVETVTTTVTGFTGEGSEKTIALGNNTLHYSFSRDYTKPSNMPITNLGHPTQSTSKISTDDSDISAIWANGSVTKTADITATGVYACFTNINGSTLGNDASSKCALTAGMEITLNNVPSEVVANKHFKFAFPADRNVTFKVKDLAGNFVNYSGTYSIETVTNAHYGVDYKVLTTTGDLVGINTYKMVLSKNLSE